MIASVSEFEDSVAFELYVLETVRPAIDQKADDSIDLRNSNVHINVTIVESMSAGSVDRLKDKLNPLLFGSAWKVIDLLFEFSLNKSGLTSTMRSGDWSINSKQAHARSGDGDRSVLGCSTEVWHALLSIYAATVEHRHCLVHRTALVDSASGELNGVDRNGQPIQPLTREEQVAFAKVAASSARSVIRGGIDSRTEVHLKYFLDQLTSHTGLAAFGVSQASAPVDILLSLSEENQAFVLDMSGVLDRARHTCPAVAHFDLLIDVPDGSGRRLFARAEDCPSGQTVIDLNNLPPWIQFR